MAHKLNASIFLDFISQYKLYIFIQWKWIEILTLSLSRRENCVKIKFNFDNKIFNQIDGLKAIEAGLGL